MFTALRLRLLAYAPCMAKTSLKICPKALQGWGLQEILNPVFKEKMTEGAMDFLQGKWLQIKVTDLDVSFCITVEKNRIKVDENQPVDSVLSASSHDFILMAARKEDPDTLFFQRRLKIEGNTELGLEVKNLIDSIDNSAMPIVLLKVLERLALDIQLNQPVV